MAFENLKNEIGIQIMCEKSTIEACESAPYEIQGDIKGDATMQDPEVAQAEFAKRTEGLEAQKEEAEKEINELQKDLVFIKALENASEKSL